MKQQFTQHLLEWHQEVDRSLPWKETNDPYKIWLSEIILQQTRVEQGIPYYLAFVDKFPDVHALATAHEDEVLRLWKGLGYYSRARNLHYTAKLVSREMQGKFPASFKELLKLKGVGEYTAAAISSFAFNQSHAVVDGNVYRLLSRYFSIDDPIDSTRGKKNFKALANELIPEDDPGKYNQAIMDFGALQCVPRQPDCPGCPLSNECVAYKLDLVSTLPVKSKKLKHKPRFFHFIVIKEGAEVYLVKRAENDIWKSLYQFPLIEKERQLTKEELMNSEEWQTIFGEKVSPQFTGRYKQTLTHQKINACFYEVNSPKIQDYNAEWIKINRQFLDKFAFPKVIDCYLSENPLY